MSVKISEMIAQRVELAMNVGAGIDAYFDDIVAGYDRYLAPVAEEGDPPFDARQHLVLLRRKVDARREGIEAVDVDLLEQLFGKDSTSADLETLTKTVDAKLRSTRHSIRGFFGPEGVARTGLKGRLPSRSERLYRRARLVQTSLLNPKVKLEYVFDFPREGEEDQKVTQADLANRLEPEVTALGQLIHTRFADQRGVVGVRSRRDQIIQDFDREMRGIIRMIHSMMRLAGLEDLASQFRYNLRTSTRTSAGTEETPGDQPAPPGEEPAPVADDSQSTP